MSAHADAFTAARRRTYTEALIDWTQDRAQSSDVFIAGDFNLELKVANETNIYTDDLKHDSEASSCATFAIWVAQLEILQSTIDASITFLSPLKLEQIGRVEVLRDAAVGRMDHWSLLVEVGF